MAHTKKSFRNKISPILFIGFFLFSLFSCNPLYYIPNTQNVPLIKEKGEGNVNIAGTQTQIELKAAYGVGNSIAVQANAIAISPNALSKTISFPDPTLTLASGYLYEGGVGYFRNIGPNFLFDTYFLIGVGYVENDLVVENEIYSEGYLNAKYMRYAIQPSFSLVYDYFSVSSSMRLATLNYTAVDGNLRHFDRLESDYLLSRSPFFVLEPALTVRGGFKKFKLELQYLYSFNLTDSEFAQKRKLFTLGLNFHF